MTLTDTSDLPALAAALNPNRYTDPETGIVYECYRDPLAPELANPYRWVDGMLIQKSVDSPRKSG